MLLKANKKFYARISSWNTINYQTLSSLSKIGNKTIQLKIVQFRDPYLKEPKLVAFIQSVLKMSSTTERGTF